MNGGLKMEWIKCSERMPEENSNVIFYENDFSCIYIGSYENIYGYKWIVNCMEIEQKVTHWMPLPEKPKGEHK